MLKKLFLISFLLISSLPIFAKGSDLQITQTEYGLEVSTFNKKGKKIIEDYIVCSENNLLFVLLRTESYNINDIVKSLILNRSDNYHINALVIAQDKNYSNSFIFHDFEDVGEFNKILIIPLSGTLESWDLECKHNDLVINSITFNKNSKNSFEILTNKLIEERVEAEKQRQKQQEEEEKRQVELQRQQEIEEYLQNYYREGDYAFTFDSYGTGLRIIYTGNDVEVRIPSTLRNTPVTEIEVFLSKNTKKVIIPSSVYSIWGFAFNKCGLENVEFENNSQLTYVNEKAFANNKLTSIPLPNKTIESIYINAFSGNPIESIVIRKGWNFVSPSNNYEYNMGLPLKTVEYENGCSTIYRNSFYGCETLKKVILPKTMKNIQKHAFENCTSLTEVIVPEGTQFKEDETVEFNNCPLDFESTKKLKQAGAKRRVHTY